MAATELASAHEQASTHRAPSGTSSGRTNRVPEARVDGKDREGHNHEAEDHDACDALQPDGVVAVARVVAHRVVHNLVDKEACTHTMALKRNRPQRGAITVLAGEKVTDTESMVLSGKESSLCTTELARCAAHVAGVQSPLEASTLRRFFAEHMSGADKRGGSEGAHQGGQAGTRT